MTWDPIAEPEAADYVLLAGKRSPGLCEIVGAGSPRNWDVRKGFGLAGAFSVYTGADLAKFSIVLRLYSRQDWADWYAWKPLVDKLPTRRFSNGKDSGALDIQHPILEALGIKAVGVENVGQPTQTDHGEWTIEIKVIQFRRPKFSLAKPEGSTATPVDPVEEQIIKPLTEQLQRLAAPE